MYLSCTSLYRHPGSEALLGHIVLATRSKAWYVTRFLTLSTENETAHVRGDISFEEAPGASRLGLWHLVNSEDLFWLRHVHLCLR